jgi:hypothetical protein
VKGRVLVSVAVGLSVLGMSVTALAEPVSRQYLIAQVKLTQESRVATNGMGPVLVGMTVEEASRSAGVRLIQSGGSDGCYTYRPPQMELKGVSFMVWKDRIVRVDVFRNSRIATLRGVRVGDSEERVRSLYSKQIQSIGQTLVFVPKDAADKDYRIVFQLDRNRRVMSYRSGHISNVFSPELC